MNRAFRERWYPASLGAAAGLGSFALPGATQLDIAKDLANPVLSILAIAVGFIAAALTILLTASDLPSLQTLRTGTRFNALVEYHWQAIVSGMLAAVLSLWVIVACKTLDTWPQIVVFHVWAGCVVWAFTAFFRVVHLLRALLRL